MTDVRQLEQRISRALDRITRSAQALRAAPDVPGPVVDAVPPTPAPLPAPDPEELVLLRAQLESERSKNAQLTERVNAVRQRQETSFTSLERRLARMTEQLDLQSLEMLRLKKANTKLIEANRQLREGHEAKVIEPSTINRSLLAELEALRAERAAEMAEIEDVLGELKPLIATGDANA